MTIRHLSASILTALALLLSYVPACTADEFSDRLIAAHNLWRDKVHVPPLKWSVELADFAQSWADHLKQSNACDMRHRNGEERKLGKQTTGENLAWKWQDPKPDSGFLYTPEEVVDAWGSELKFYAPKSGACKGGVCGHYTQLVWHNSTEVGCGRASCGKAEVWVCNYLPAGNYVGEKAY